MGGKPGTLKTTSSASGRPSLEPCRRQQCSASTCAGSAESLGCRRRGAIRSRSGPTQAPKADRRAQPPLAPSWSGGSSSERL